MARRRRRSSLPGPVLRALARYWGVIPAFILLGALSGPQALAIGPVVLSGALLLLWSLVSAPGVCCAVNREKTKDGDPTYCRNNSNGLLLGCSQVRQHKLQKITTRLWWFSFLQHHGWRELWKSPSAWLATLSAVAGIVTAIIGVNVWLLRHLNF
jgi:hypothetical protein